MARRFLHNFYVFDKLCDQAMNNVLRNYYVGRSVRFGDWRHTSKELFESYWKTMLTHGALTARFANSPVRMEIINTVQSVLKQQEGEVLLLQTEMVDLESVTKTQARRALFSDAQGLLAEQRETVRFFSEPARDDSNPQHAPPLEVELESIQKGKSTRRPSPWTKRSCRCSSARNQGVSYLWDLVLIGLVSTYSGP